MLARIPDSAKRGIAILLIGIGPGLLCWLWYATRTWTPVDRPITLSGGPARTQPFKINVESTYELFLEVDCESEREDCSVFPAAGLSWSASRDGVIVGQGKLKRERYWDWYWRNRKRALYGLGWFPAIQARYVVEIDAHDADALNARHPRLIVVEGGGEGAESEADLSLAFSFAFMCTVISAPMLVRWRVRADEVPPFTDVPLGAAEFQVVYDRQDAVLARLRRAPRVRPRILPSMSLVVLLVLLCIFIPWFVFRTAFGYTPRGLPVGAVRYADHEASTAGTAVVVRVTLGEHDEPGLYINGEAVSYKEFPTRLRSELAVRPTTWPVYVEGDGDLPWADVAFVIDDIEAQHAKVVLLTK